MLTVQLKISDLAKVTGYTRFQMHGLLDELAPSRMRTGKKTRSQRSFSAQDLIVITVVCELEKKFSVKRSVLASVSEPLRKTLTGPRKANREARILVSFSPPTATYLGPEQPATEGLVLSLGPIFAKVDEYLGVAGNGRDGGQALLALSPTIVANRRGNNLRNR